MKTDVSFEVTPFEPVLFIGKETVAGKDNLIKELWDEFLYKGGADFLTALPNQAIPNGDCAGWMGDYNEKTKEFTYIVGIFFKPGSPVPEGYVSREIPACLMGIGKIRGKTQHLEKGAHTKTEKVMRAAGYEPDYAPGFSMEYYPYEKYGLIEDNGENTFEFHYYLPCKKK